VQNKKNLNKYLQQSGSGNLLFRFFFVKEGDRDLQDKNE